MSVKIYGIKNCDTMKKAFKWLDDNNVAYEFHDYKKDGVDVAVLSQAIDTYHWKQVINQRGTTWRQLPEDIKENMDEMMARTVAMSNPSIIKRPIITTNDDITIGYDEDTFAQTLK